MPEFGALYAGIRGRITELARAATAEQIESRVPACPDWTMRELVAHLSGICTDILNGNLEGVGTDPWTAEQVGARRDWTLDRILDEWTEAGPKCEAMASFFPERAAAQWVADATTHEHDLRGALDAAGARDSETVVLGLEWIASRLDEVTRAEGWPSLRLVTAEGDSYVAGDEPAADTVTAPRFELFRALTGRRSERQIAAFDWDGDYTEHLDVFRREPFSLARNDVLE